MKIKSIYVNNFKSLIDFRIDLADFNCLIGLNGSGKSTFLQFVSFLSQLMRGDINRWLERREWKNRDIFCSIGNTFKWKPLEFEITFYDDNNMECIWESKFSVSNMRCFSEKIVVGNKNFYTFKRTNIDNTTQRYFGIKINETDAPYECRINYQYTGSILSVLKDSEVDKYFNKFKDYVKNIETVDLLAPQYLRRRARTSHGSIGPGGEYLSALLHELGKEKNKKISDSLKKIYPTLQNVKIKSLRSGWKQIEIGEMFKGHFFTLISTESRHVNDGMLRMLGFLSQIETDYSFLLFDEIENGINPELIGFLLKELIESDKQIIVTTHSPMILNYLDDETAIPGVHFFYKTPEGFTKTVPFLSIPSMREKLEMMGPGEVFIDTNLTELAKDISQTSQKEG